jgi:hypothetical protein
VLREAVAEPQQVPGEVGEIVGLELVQVEQESQMRIWNELMSQMRSRLELRG